LHVGLHLAVDLELNDVGFFDYPFKQFRRAQGEAGGGVGGPFWRGVREGGGERKARVRVPRGA
jgi:hypothetical protein